MKAVSGIFLWSLKYNVSFISSFKQVLAQGIIYWLLRVTGYTYIGKEDLGVGLWKQNQSTVILAYNISIISILILCRLRAQAGWDVQPKEACRTLLSNNFNLYFDIKNLDNILK
jgi:sulfite exporter TauE/SafE